MKLGHFKDIEISAESADMSYANEKKYFNFLEIVYFGQLNLTFSKHSFFGEI